MALYKEKRTKFYYKHGKETHIIICFDSRTQIYKGYLSYNHGMEIYKTNNEESRIYKICQKYLSNIFNTVLILCVTICCYSCKNSNSNKVTQSLITDSATVNSIHNDYSNAITKTHLKTILSQLVGKMDSDEILSKVNRYFTKEYKNIFLKTYKNSKIENYASPKIWWQYSDSDPMKFNIKELNMISDNKAKANIQLSSDLYIGNFDIILENEHNIWLIDKITQLSIENISGSVNIANNYAWLQGHWIYKQGNYEGHLIIQGDQIAQYSNTNPQPIVNFFRIEENELRARIADGVDFVVKIDTANHRIDYGEGNWMYKIE